MHRIMFRFYPVICDLRLRGRRDRPARYAAENRDRPHGALQQEGRVTVQEARQHPTLRCCEKV